MRERGIDHDRHGWVVVFILIEKYLQFMPPQQNYRIDLSFLITTPVTLDRPESGGSGFFFHYDTSTYIVTAAHVLADGELDGCHNLRSEIRRDPPVVSYYLRDSNVDNPVRRTVDLSEEEQNWGIHPDDPDIAVIQIGEELKTLSRFIDEDVGENRFVTFSMTDREFIGNNRLVTDRVSSLGYPRGRLYDLETRFPIRRNALVASPLHFDFEGEHKFLTDARMDPGTSGSPVLVKPSQVVYPWGEHLRQDAPVLLGVHSGNYPYPNEGNESEGDNLRNTRYSDLNETWRPETIVHTIREVATS